MKVVWNRLIRFVATDGRVLRGEPILPHPDFDLGKTTAKTALQAKVITGDDLYDTKGSTKVSDEVVTVQKLLGPLTSADVDIMRCVGLNYAKHSKHLGTSILTLGTDETQSKKRAEHHLHSHSSFSSRQRVCRITTAL